MILLLGLERNVMERGWEVKPERSGGDHLRGSSRNLLCQLMARLGTLRPEEAKRAFSDFILIILKAASF